MATSAPSRRDSAATRKKAIRGLAGRIAYLLGAAGGKAEANPHLIATLDDLLGAVYSLYFAEDVGFQDRTTLSIEKDAVRRRARALERDAPRQTGPWMAGLHLNSAAFRLAAVYHRSLQLVTNNLTERRDVSTLVAEADALFQTWADKKWSHQNISKIHDQVNVLKHKAIGQFHARKAKQWQTAAAAAELLELLEAWWSTKRTHDVGR